MSAPAHRGPRRVTFVTNPDDCNLACPMCRDHGARVRGAPGPGRGPPRRLSLALVEQVLAQCQGTRLREVVASTRGEPLLWDGLDGLARACSARGLMLNLTTNGTFPGRGAAAWAELLVPVCSDVKVSCNAATQGTAAALMPGLRLDRALAGVEALARVRDRRLASGERACSLSFQVTAQEGNVGELPSLVRLARELGVDRVKVNQLQVHHPALAGQDLRRSAGSRARWNAAVDGMRAAAEAPRRGGGRLRLQNVAPWPDGSEQPFGPCPFLGEEAWVGPDGAFAPCPAPAAQDGALGSFGSLREAPLATLWEGNAYRALVAGYARRSTCARCALRRPGGL